MKHNGITFLYILYNQSANKYYTGITTDSIQYRVQKHNDGTYGHRFTSMSNDWICKLSIDCESYSIARKLELYIKRMKSRKFIETLINSSFEQNKLLSKFASDSPDASGQGVRGFGTIPGGPTISERV